MIFPQKCVCTRLWPIKLQLNLEKEVKPAGRLAFPLQRSAFWWITTLLICTSLITMLYPWRCIWDRIRRAEMERVRCCGKVAFDMCRHPDCCAACSNCEDKNGKCKRAGARAEMSSSYKKGRAWRREGAGWCKTAALSSETLSHSRVPSVLFIQTVLQWILKDNCGRRLVFDGG